ncbi:MAG: hypothetical protein GF311_07060 [Candidatus Lokiarchaeota archaeon]|nr:hypothetical protein [Candidatus Lokiarchaeota archaeon]
MKKNNKKLKPSHYIFAFILILTVLVFFSSLQFNFRYNHNSYESTNPKISAIQGYLNLTNADEINNKMFQHNTTLIIKGELTHPDPIKQNDLKGVEVSLFVNGALTPFNNISTSDPTPKFFIEYTVGLDLDVTTQHKIEANVTEDIGGSIILQNYYMIDVNATSYFDIPSPDRPYIPSEEYIVNGYVKYDYQGGEPIANSQINYNWYNTTDNLSSGSLFSGGDGSIGNIPIPSNIYSNTINLSLNSIEIPGQVISSEFNITNIQIFRNISCTWNLINETSEGQDYTIQGQIWAKNNPSLKIYNRRVNIYYEGEGLIGGTSTDSNGNFSFSYSIPSGTGNRTISVQLVNTGGVFLSNQTLIFITVSNPVLPNPLVITPFQWFFIIGIPIIIGIIAALGIYGYLHYKKEISASRLVNIPLEGKIRNLKILKDSGRIEEALSYLFNAIYVELVAAKYGRKRKINETIRDFAIISVQDFRLDPAKIYPFIQKIEQIIYAQPFKITEEEFYKTIELFSPVYYQLTGYNFVLNF